MKKIIFLFLIAGAVVFFAGWTQLAVPAGSFGVLRSKTHGLNTHILHGGNFNWIWYRLIPGNTSITSFTLTPCRFRIEIKGSLPQAETLTALTGLKDFLWKISCDMSFLIMPEALPGIVDKNDISDQTQLNAYLLTLTEDIKAYANQRVSYYFSNVTSTNIEENFSQISKNGALNSISSDIKEAFPVIQEMECRFVIKETPDFEEWKTAKSLYTAYLNRQHSLLHDEIAETALRKINSELRFDELARYGELLTKYPILIQYLNLEQKNNGEIK
ncbi:MAG: hypothetical protein LBD07_03330 [Spirochaetaceae bacterium]|nr:hypothetical protein [Spirochaetaceae bacterium]